jgi:hypothetical protein
MERFSKFLLAPVQFRSILKPMKRLSMNHWEFVFCLPELGNPVEETANKFNRRREEINRLLAELERDEKEFMKESITEQWNGKEIREAKEQAEKR